ncbi:MAG: head decoration protein [Hyphomicrobiaceae bacterium]
MTALRTLTFDEPARVSDVLKFEVGTYNREQIVIASGAGVLGIGSVLGQITKGAATSAAKAGGNTGNGALTLDVTTPVLAAAKAGVYTVRCITAAANGGTFRVTDPDGLVIGDVAVAATFATGIKFAIADGASDFIVGDGFDITVAAGSLKWAHCPNTAVDGSEIARAVLLEKVDATSADKSAVVVVRGPAEVSRHGLVWHSSVDTLGKKNAKIDQLKTSGIVTREGH